MISIIIPVIRPEKAKRCIDAIRAHGFDGEILTLVDTERIGCPKMVRRLVDMASNDQIVFLGDDTIPQAGWLDEVQKTMATLPDGWGIVGFGDNGETRPIHWMADRRMLPLLDGEFFHTGYRHCLCDNELQDRAEELGRYAYCSAAMVEHDNEMLSGGEPTDPDLQVVYSKGVLAADRSLYVKRKRERLGKLAIGFPLVDSTVPVPFFASFVCMAKPSEYTFLMPKFQHGPWSESIANARNSLVEQAQIEGAKWLLMCDTDQVYPPDTLTKLLQHGKDVCGVRVHRRWPPFDPIFYRGSIGQYQNVPDEEAYSGRLIEVDATGTGCLLINMEVFDEMAFPWFAFGVKNGKAVGEDITFCSKVRESGRQIFIDTSIEVGHLTVMEVGKTLHQICKHISRRN